MTSNTASNTNGKTLFTNARLIDGIADQAITGISMLVEGERIAKISQGNIDVMWMLST